MIAGKGSAEYNWICPAYRSLAGFEVSLVGRFSSVPRGSGRAKPNSGRDPGTVLLLNFSEVTRHDGDDIFFQVSPRSISQCAPS